MQIETWPQSTNINSTRLTSPIPNPDRANHSPVSGTRILKHWSRSSQHLSPHHTRCKQQPNYLRARCPTHDAGNPQTSLSAAATTYASFHIRRSRCRTVCSRQRAPHAVTRSPKCNAARGVLQTVDQAPGNTAVPGLSRSRSHKTPS